MSFAAMSPKPNDVVPTNFSDEFLHFPKVFFFIFVFYLLLPYFVSVELQL